MHRLPVHLLGARGARIDVAVHAGLVALVAEVDLKRLETLAAYRGKVGDFEKGERRVHGGRLSPKSPRNTVVSFAVLQSVLPYLLSIPHPSSTSPTSYT